MRIPQREPPLGRARRARPALALGLAIGATICGCMVGPDYHRPAIEPQASWGEPAENPVRGQAAAGSAPTGSTAAAAPADLPRWWESLHDPELDSLIRRATDANLDLRRAAARVREARAQRMITAAPLFPALGSGASYTRSRDSENAPQALNSVAINDNNLYQVGFDAVWELDVFGGNRRNLEAAKDDVQASVEDLRDVLVSLLAEVARAYVDYRGAQQQTEIARVNLDAQRSTLDLTRQRYAAGLAAELDVVRAAAQVTTTEAVIPTLQARARVDVHELGVLLGQGPSALSEELAANGQIPSGPSQIPLGVPSDVLQRRPDIRRAERQLAAQTARIGVATRDLYPRFFLFGAAGLESFKASDWWTWPSKYYAAGPSVSWPIFSGGSITGNIRLQDAKQAEQLADYHQTILHALEEVEDAVVAFTQEQDRRSSLRESVASNSRATELARQLYTQGLTDFLSVLDAERSLFVSQDALVQSESAVTNDLIALYKALGGGWDEDAADAAQQVAGDRSEGSRDPSLQAAKPPGASLPALAGARPRASRAETQSSVVLAFAERGYERSLR